ncbi:MAG: cytochrome b/b6 domain-containing protein [Actinomycetaceae bacterium]|nr:cytochrome b/b6 domain-containing protein [Actinomycetaceae bacterium]
MAKKEVTYTNPALKAKDDTRVVVLRHTKATRTRHALVIITTFALILTGFLMWAGMKDMSGFVGVLHAVLGLVFIAIPLFWVFTNFRHFSAFIDDITHYDADDMKWMAKGGGYLGGDPAKLPAQGKYNAGQKLVGLLMVICGILLGISGLIMAFATTTFGITLHVGEGTKDVLWRIHLVVAIVMLVLVLSHIFLSLMAKNAPALNSMFGDGTVDLDYAKEHYERWMEEEVAVLEDESEKLAAKA